MLARIWKRSRNERGITIVIVAFSMTVVLGAAALAIDVGKAVTARTEAQRAADSAALAGAGTLISMPGDAGAARKVAIAYAAKNRIRNVSAVVLPEDVDVDLATNTVTVRVKRTVARGNAISTHFARVFGINELDIGAVAAAQVTGAGAINCLLPLAVPDRWHEAGGIDNDPDDFNPEYGDTYTPWAQPGIDPPRYNDPYTGYSIYDHGTEIRLKANGGGGSMNPSWYYPWRAPNQAGGDDYRTNINSCVDPSIEYYVGMVVDTEPGSMNGPTMQGFRDLIAKDPDARWNTGMKCVVGKLDQYSGDPTACRGSERIRPVPMFDPTEEPDPGAKPFTFTNFAGIFVDQVNSNEVWVRFVDFRGVKPADGGPTSGPLFQFVRLVK